MTFFKYKKFKIVFVLISVLVGYSIGFPSTQMPETSAENDSLQSFMRQNSFNESFDSFTLFLKTIGFVILLSVVLFLFLKWYRRNVYGNNFNKNSSEMKLLGAINIGPKKSICMVNVLEHVLVLGLTENEMSLLLDIPQDSISEPLKANLFENENEPPQNFGKILNQWMKKNTA